MISTKSFFKQTLFLVLALIVVLMMDLPIETNTFGATDYNFCFPVNNGCKIAYYQGYTSEYGANHDGVDIHSKGDDTIYAAYSGVVDDVANSCDHINYGAACKHYKTYGNYIRIKGDNGIYFYYGHLKQNSITVKKGDRVEKGQAIATMGSSGYSTGKHLHFEIRQTTSSSTRLNANPKGTLNGLVTYKDGPYGNHNDCVNMTTGNYYIKNKSTNTYMQAEGASNTAKLSLATKKETSAFILCLTGSKSAGYYLETKLNKKYVVNPYSDTPKDGITINIYEKSNDGTQIWSYDKTDNGYIIHMKNNSNLCLTANGTSVVLKNRTGSANQIWILESESVPVTNTTATTSSTTTSTTTTTTTATKVIPMNQFKGSGTLNDPYQISSPAELKKLSEFVNDPDYCSHYAHAHYIQTADIDLENEEWTPIGIGSINNTYTYENMFHGSYDGNQHCIYNLKITKNNHVVAGLFGYTDGEYTENRGYIHDLVVTGDINSPQSMNSGGIVGRIISGSVIENCGFIGNISGGGNSSAWSGAGGIVGCFYASGAIRNCYHTGNVTSGTRAGGIAGMIRFYDKNENLTAEVTRCFHAVGKISGGTMDGGITSECVLYGTGNEVLITECYVSSDSGTNIKLLNTALNSTQMKAIAEMKKLGDVLGNPFVNNPETSLFSLNSGYPIFFWQIEEITGDINSDGKVSINDAVLLQEYLLGKEQLTEEQFLKADINSDGTTDIFDMVIMRKLIIEK
ncbi:MAG: peptidoglycan DD-metalloendopeptidase family protein [Ruminococcus sp.]|nr:peptidoglycan DD-metalloendopeptidase family protein [Ruminococcus sp.]